MTTRTRTLRHLVTALAIGLLVAEGSPARAQDAAEVEAKKKAAAEEKAKAAKTAAEEKAKAAKAAKEKVPAKEDAKASSKAKAKTKDAAKEGASTDAPEEKSKDGAKKDGAEAKDGATEKAETAKVDEDGMEELDPIPTRFFPVTDASGNNWGLEKTGAVTRSHAGFTAAAALKVNGDAFEPVVGKKNDAENRYVLGAEIKGLDVERDVWIDAERGFVRYVDSFKNAGDDEAKVVAEIETTLPNPWGSVLASDGGAFAGGELGKRVSGVLGSSANGKGLKSALFLLADEKSKSKPEVTLNGTSGLTAKYTFTVPAGETRAVLHLVKQVPESAGGDAYKDETKEIYRKRKLIDMRVPEALAPTLVNFKSGDQEDDTPGPEMLLAVNRVGERLGIERGESDLLWVAEDSQLSGNAANVELELATRFGDVKVKTEDLAMLQGGGGRGRQQKIFLRDGTALSGEILAGGLKLAGDQGWNLELKTDQLEYLVTALGEDDGVPPEGANGYVALHTGDVLPCVLADQVQLQFITPWGAVEIPLNQIVFLRYMKEPSPRYRVDLADGSKLTAFMVNDDLQFQSPRFGVVTFRGSEVAAMWQVQSEVPELTGEFEEILDLEDVEGGACLLKGSNVVAGTIGNEVLSMVSGATITELKPSEIEKLRRADEDDSELIPLFTAELVGGDQITGHLKERTIGIQGEQRLWEVPVQHFLAAKLPDEVEPEPPADAGDQADKDGDHFDEEL